MAPPPVTPVPLLNYPDPSVSDYRLAISPDGTQIIFERTLQNTPVQLYLAVLGSSSSPSVFPPNTPFQSATRPDWSWSNGQVAFCIKNSAGVVTTDADGSNLTDVANTQNMIYPAWTPDGAYIAVMNEQTSSEYVSPRTTVIDTAGTPKTPTVANNTVWAGMPSVNPTNQNQFVFAGQWIGSQTSYDQNKNYVWFADLSTDPITLRPLDQKANSSGPFQSAFQGRAPWWSPDGNWVAFESNRLVIRTANSMGFTFRTPLVHKPRCR